MQNAIGSWPSGTSLSTITLVPPKSPRRIHGTVTPRKKFPAASILSPEGYIPDKKPHFQQRMIAMVSEEERRRIGRDLHDVMAQQLAAIVFLSRALETKLTTEMPALLPEAAQLAELATEAALQVRDLSSSLYPVDLERRGLVASLEKLSQSQTHIYRKPCTFRHKGKPSALEPMVALNLFRIAQEAVANALRHSQAKRVLIQFHATKKQLCLIVSDNGRGFVPGRMEPDGKGICIMYYRAESIGAHLRIATAKPHGTVITCVLKLSPKSK